MLGGDGELLASSWCLPWPTSLMCQSQNDHLGPWWMILVALSWLLLVLEFHELVKLARYAMAMKDFWIMAAERVVRRAE